MSDCASLPSQQLRNGLLIGTVEIKKVRLFITVDVF
jgi:hypothetical protein